MVEERRARDGWGAHASLAIAQALAAGDLLPIDHLNDGFVRPDRPERIGLSYYQASLVMEYLEAHYGIEGVRAMLQGYADGGTTDSVLRQVSGVSVDSLQGGFDAWIADRFATPVTAIASGDPGVFGAPLAAAGGRSRRATRRPRSPCSRRHATGIRLWRTGWAATSTGDRALADRPARRGAHRDRLRDRPR